MAGRSVTEQKAFEDRIRKKNKERIRAELEENRKNKKKIKRKPCNCGRIK